MYTFKIISFYIIYFWNIIYSRMQGIFCKNRKNCVGINSKICGISSSVTPHLSLGSVSDVVDTPIESPPTPVDACWPPSFSLPWLIIFFFRDFRLCEGDHSRAVGWGRDFPVSLSMVSVWRSHSSKGLSLKPTIKYCL